LTLSINAITLLSSYRHSRRRKTWPETTWKKHSSLFVCCVSDEEKGFITSTLTIDVIALYPHTDKVAGARLGLKQPGENTLAYLSFVSVMKKKVS